MEEETEKIQITVLTESLFQSIVADGVSFFMLSVMFYVNAHYIQSRLFTAIILILFFVFCIAYAFGRTNVYTSRAAAIKALSKKQ